MKTNNLPSALRIRTAVILLSIIGCFMSCKSKNEPHQVTLKEKAEEVAAYLTDNYAVGDSVFFVTETGETEGFIVTINYFVELTEIHAYSPEEEPDTVLTGYQMSTEMKSEKDTLLIEISVDEPQKGIVDVGGSIAINHKFDVEFNLTTKMAGDSITISYPSYDKSCTLRKNVGLTRVQNNSSTWDLIQ